MNTKDNDGYSDFSYVANNRDTVKLMLQSIGLNKLEELFADIPPHLTITKKPSASLPEKHTELEVTRRMTELSRKNFDSTITDSFIGSGVYDHYSPAGVSEIMGRAEFRTAYTPYAPELSQGLLTTLFEYQSMICELTGLEIANTSMYDWSTALAEAALMAMRIGNKKNPVILVAETIHSDRLATLQTFAKPQGLKIELIQYSPSGQLNLDDLKKKLTDSVIGLYIENPNLFGLLEMNLQEIGNNVHEKGALLIVGIDPISLGVLEAPGNLGADICVGEAHHLGSPSNFGGPAIGILTSRNTKNNIRNMPGRIIGYTRTKDDTKDAYIMTLQTREQHIRREKATSNICTNESLYSVGAATYLALMGPKGLEDLGKELLGRIDYIREKITSANTKVKVHFNGNYFKEILISLPKGSYNNLQKRLQNKKILIGPNISEKRFQNLQSDAFILSISEKHTKKQLDTIIEELISFGKEVA